jgi:hypothetical protein
LGKTEVITVKLISSTTNLKFEADVGGKKPAANCLKNVTALRKYVSTAECE